MNNTFTAFLTELLFHTHACAQISNLNLHHIGNFYWVNLNSKLHKIFITEMLFQTKFPAACAEWKIRRTPFENRGYFNYWSYIMTFFGWWWISKQKYIKFINCIVHASTRDGTGIASFDSAYRYSFAYLTFLTSTRWQ